MCGPLAEQIAFLDRVALAEEAALYADRAAAEVAARRLMLRQARLADIHARHMALVKEEA